MRRVPLPALALAILAACGEDPPAPADRAIARPSATPPPASAASLRRPTGPAPAPIERFEEPAPIPPVRELPFPCVPEGAATAPAWTARVDAPAVTPLLHGDELVLAGLGPAPTLAAIALSTGEARLRVALEPGLALLAADAGVAILGRGGEAPLLQGISLADGAVLWTSPLPPGPLRLVAAGDGPLVLREGPDGEGRFRLTARDPATGLARWSRDFAGAPGDLPHVLRSGDRLIVSAASQGPGPAATVLDAVDLAGGDRLWTRREEGRLERLLADAGGRLHAGLRAGAGGGYVLSLHRDGLVRWALRRPTVEGPDHAARLDGPALAGADRVLLVAALLLEGSTGATVGRAPYAAPAAFHLAGRSAFGFVSWTPWYDAALYGLDLSSGRARFAIRQRDGGPPWNLAGSAPTTGGSLLAAFSVVHDAGVAAALCELDETGRATHTVRLADPPDDGTVVGSFAAGDRWLEVIEVARPWPDGPRVEVRAYALDGFSPPEPPRPLGSCSGEVTDTCG